MKHQATKRSSTWLALMLVITFVAFPAPALEENADGSPKHESTDQIDAPVENVPDDILNNDIADSTPEISQSTDTPKPSDSSTKKPITHDENSENNQTNEESQPIMFYTVMFVDHDNSTVAITQVQDGHCVSEPEAPSPAPEGFEFAFWYDVTGDGTAFNFNTPITVNMTIKTLYTPVAVEPDSDDIQDATAEQTTPDEEEPTMVSSGSPRVEIEFSYEGDILLEGAQVTMTAKVYNVPENTDLSFQWQNNATGRYEDVPGATEQTYSFYADEGNSGCLWRVKVEGTPRL